MEDVPEYNNEEQAAREAEISSIRPEAAEYFDKMLDLCRQENIPFLLIKIPSAYYWNAERSRNVADFAK